MLEMPFQRPPSPIEGLGFAFGYPPFNNPRSAPDNAASGRLSCVIHFSKQQHENFKRTIRHVPKALFLSLFCVLSNVIKEMVQNLACSVELWMQLRSWESTKKFKVALTYCLEELLLFLCAWNGSKQWKLTLIITLTLILILIILLIAAV